MNGGRHVMVDFILGGSAFLVTGAILTLTLSPGDTPVEGNALWRLILSMCYLSVAAILIPYHREALYLIRRNWPLLAMVALALLSCFWAEMPAFSFRRSIAVAGATLLGIALAVRLSPEGQLRILSWVFRLISVLSLACIVLLPSYGISNTAEHEWRGVLSYKNAFGSIMGMSVLVEWQLHAFTRFSKILNWLALLLSLVLLIFSQSITPLVALTGAFVLIEIYKFAGLRLRMPLYSIALVTVLILSLVWGLYDANHEAIMGALGRNSDLTGRTEIWSWVISFILKRPILGYGYSGFWAGASAESSAVERAVGAFTQYSHNGFLDTFLTLGAVGFFLAVGYLALGVRRAYYWSKQGQSPTNLWPLAFLLFFLLYNLGECSILLQDLQWTICVAVVASTDQMLFEPEEEQEDAAYLEPGEEFA